MAHLRGLFNLRELILANTSVTIRAMEHIKGLCNLLTLDVTGTQIRTTTKGFRRALPNCLVLPFRDLRDFSYQAKDARRRGLKIASAIVKEQNIKAKVLEANISRHKAVDAQGGKWLYYRKAEHPSFNWTFDTLKRVVDAGLFSLDDMYDWTDDKFKVLAKGFLESLSNSCLNQGKCPLQLGVISSEGSF